MRKRDTKQRSIETVEPTDSAPSANLPRATKWRQQKIAACRPIYTAKPVISIVFLVGFIFIPLGYFMLIASDSVQEWSYEYENCGLIGSTCQIEINLPSFSGDVYFYYEIWNYHQNARRYLRNWNSKQLIGDLGCTTSCSDPYKNAIVNLSKSQCKSRKAPGDRCPTTFWQDGACRRAIAPCGAIANSMFNDTFLLRDSNDHDVPFTYSGLLHPDTKTRYKNPPLLSGERDLCDAFHSRTIQPPSWSKSVCELDTQNPENNGFQNFDFIVWMDVAALPNFRKPYRRLNRQSDDSYRRGLPAGRYTLVVQNNYNVSMFKARKKFVITTTSWLGGKNRFFGIAYLAIGCVCILLGFILLLIHWLFGHTLTEIAQLPGAK